jgi:hypothetical protein
MRKISRSKDKVKQGKKKVKMYMSKSMLMSAVHHHDTWQSFLAFLRVIWPSKKVTHGTVRR